MTNFIKGQLFAFRFQNKCQVIPLHPLQWSVGHPTYWWPSWRPPCLYRSWWGQRGRSWSHTASARPQTHWNEGSNEERKKEKSPLWLITRYVSQQQLPDSTLTPQPHRRCKKEHREPPSNDRGSIYVRLHVTAMSSKLQRFPLLWFLEHNSGTVMWKPENGVSGAKSSLWLASFPVRVGKSLWHSR